MEKIRVDFNRQGRNGVLISSIRRASGPIRVREIVEVFEPGEDDMTACAVVEKIFDSGRVELALLSTSWSDFRMPASWTISDPQFSVEAGLPVPSSQYYMPTVVIPA